MSSRARVPCAAVAAVLPPAHRVTHSLVAAALPPACKHAEPAPTPEPTTTALSAATTSEADVCPESREDPRPCRDETVCSYDQQCCCLRVRGPCADADARPLLPPAHRV